MGESYALLAYRMTAAPDLTELIGRYRDAQLEPPNPEAMARLHAVAMVAIMGELLRHSQDTQTIRSRLDALHERAPTKDELIQWRADLRGSGWWAETGRRVVKLGAVVAGVVALWTGLEWIVAKLATMGGHK